METQQQTRTFFDTYRSKLSALAATRNMEPKALKILIDHALSEEMDRFSGHETRPAQSKLAQLKIGPRELGFLFRPPFVRK